MPRRSTRSTPLRNFGVRFTYAFVGLRRFADLFFAKRYRHRAIVRETVRAVSGMVGATLIRQRRIEDDCGWIRTLMDEADHCDMNHSFATQMLGGAGQPMSRQA